MSYLLSSYLDGQVDEEERNRVEQHLATCQACHAELAQLRLVVDTMRATPAVDPGRSFTLTPDMVRRPSWLSLWSTYSPAAAAIAALLLVAVVFAGFLMESGVGGASAPVAGLTQSATTLDSTAVVEAAPAQPAEEVALAPAPPSDLAPAATAAAAALPQDAAPEPSISALDSFAESPAEPESGSEPAPPEALAAAPLALEAPYSSEDDPAGRRGLGSPPRPGATGATTEESSLLDGDITSTAPEALAAEVTQPDAGSEETPESPAIARAAERDTTEALERTAEAPPRAEPRTIRRAIRAAEVGLGLVLVVALATWGSRAARARRAPRA